MAKFPKKSLIDMSPVEVYNLVLTNQLARFPKYYWELPGSKESSREILEYLFDKILIWNEDDIKERFCKKILLENRLSGILKAVFDHCLFDVIDHVYPGKFKPWEFKSSHVGMIYWNEETSIQAVKWLIEDKLKWSKEDVKKNLSRRIFAANGLKGLVGTQFNNSPFMALDAAYPGEYNAWEVGWHVPNSYWKNSENRVNAIKWLIEDKLMIPPKDAMFSVSIEAFNNNKLGGMLNMYYKSSPVRALREAYPDI